MTKGLPSEVIVIGAGVFGISTAIAIGKRYPETKVHVIDRYEPPVEDGTSVDTTRCLRVDYTNDIYYNLAKESMAIIEADPAIAPFFHKVGMSFVYDGNSDKWEDIWIKGLASSRHVNAENPSKTVLYNNNVEVFQRIHGKDHSPKTAEELGRETKWNKGYTNLSNGYIDAKKSMKAYYERAKTFSNIDFTFKEVDKIVYEEGTNKATGVAFKDQSLITSDLVVVAAGAWTSKLVDLYDLAKTSAIEVAWLKVTKEEEEQWKNMSITTNFSTGINLFPPYEGEIKTLRRSAGYKNSVEIPSPNPLAKDGSSIKISYPRTILSNPNDWIPEDAELALRENLKEIMPSLADRPFDRTKVCWLTQTPSANFIIDFHPELQNVVLATGGSAHAWKFVPVLGDKVVDMIIGQLDPVLKDLWSWEEKTRTTLDNGSAPRMTGEPQEISQVIRQRPADMI
ncbi:unnamed protein product [Kuraishia capsulata CBS 1993]|uniref:FAD dependent oxidoreductase domain-containing protein n=1 Tax=Kuraishia capsulata CBS 1993 TaxID=1382522 RepID=W6MWY1_9ASCO|nr:uncharacterized protein KUCA_T00003970001 [Kuraishia capsulata CBS 1993]CDK27990.1 unnamed protein product [Kuraishia capsulata CBS 1993]